MAGIDGLRCEVFVIAQGVVAHAECAQARIIGQVHREGWLLLAGMGVLIDEVTHGAEVRAVFA